MTRRIALLAAVLALAVGSSAVYASPASDAYAELAAHEDAQDARIAALEARVAAFEGSDPGPSDSPVVTPSPHITPTPAPSPVATPAPSPAVAVACGASLQAVLDAAPAGATVDLGSCVYSGSAAVVNITKAVTIRRGTIKPTGFDAVSIRASDVTIDGTAFDGGGWTIRIFGVDRTKILRSSFRGMSETSIFISGPGADDTLIEGNTITQSVVTSHGYSAISGRGGPTGGVCCNRNLVIRGNTIDNGPTGVAWFGVETWDNTGLLIEGNTTKGAGFHYSIPRSDGAIFRNNTLDLSLAFDGIEIAQQDNVQVLDNVAFATGTVNMAQQWRAFVQLHPGSGTVNGTLIAGNRLTNYPALVNAPPPPAVGKVYGPTTVRDNCLENVGRIAWGTWGPVTLTNNGPCPPTPSPSPTSTASPTASPAAVGAVPFASRPASGALSYNGNCPPVISNKTFANLGANVIAIRIVNCSNVIVENVDFLNVAEGVFAATSSNITIRDSRYSNITGPHLRVGINRGNFVQFDHVTGGLIARNKGKGGDTEDIVSIFASKNVTVEDNHFEGTDWTSTSGSGIALGDIGGSGNIARRNILLNPGQVGIFIAGGTNNQIVDNIIIGEQRPASNVGMYVWKQPPSSTAVCTGHVVAGNRGSWRSATGASSTFWNAGNCGVISSPGGAFINDPALLPAAYRVNL